MTVSSPTRHAALILVFSKGQELLIDEIEGLSGLDKASRRLGTEVCIHSGPPDGDACEVHLERLWTRAAGAMGELETSSSALAYCALQIVQYIGSGDPVGPGIPVPVKWVNALAALGGCLDIDQYVVDGPSRG